MDDIYVGIREETSEGEPESDLRQHVCPSCGNVDILTGDKEMDQDVKPILAGDKLDECCSYYRCAGGFGEFRYRYLPQETEREMELLKQRLQAQQHYILQAADPSQVQIYADGRPIMQVPQPNIRPWDIHHW